MGNTQSKEVIVQVLLLSDSFQGVQPKDLGKMSALQGLRRLAISGVRLTA